MNLSGLGISVFIARFAFSGYSSLASPTLLRLTVAFASISAGFSMILGSLFIEPQQYSQFVLTAGLGLQAVGYFFIAFSHSMKSFDIAGRFGRQRLPVFYIPFVASSFIIPGNSIEHLIRSISFI